MNNDYSVSYFEGADEQFYVHIMHKNGQIPLSSEGYITKWNAKRAAKRISKVFKIPLLNR